jgi:hypothetical protein
MPMWSAQDKKSARTEDAADFTLRKPSVDVSQLLKHKIGNLKEVFSVHSLGIIEALIVSAVLTFFFFKSFQRDIHTKKVFQINTLEDAFNMSRYTVF